MKEILIEKYFNIFLVLIFKREKKKNKEKSLIRKKNQKRINQKRKTIIYIRIYINIYTLYII